MLAMTSDRIRAKRLEANLTIEALAFKSGLSVRTISRAELGQHEPNVATLRAIADALGTTAGDLIEGRAS